ncbi:uncharacterized protein LOC130367122 isoform X2 [Hyla sarda]|uniref:uncharacterized protein LOC130367122 isoform X2 n=1 Tax=Hyla sarda TaxID=327740 RepID=UPI0024C3C142|nr:uncharacterized protein LOC130367122 isoform X2 [Hyla sarda]
MSLHCCCRVPGVSPTLRTSSSPGSTLSVVDIMSPSSRRYTRRSCWMTGRRARRSDDVEGERQPCRGSRHGADTEEAGNRPIGRWETGCGLPQIQPLLGDRWRETSGDLSFWRSHI